MCACVSVKLTKLNTHYKLPFGTLTSHTFSDMMANMSFTDAGTQMMVCLGGREVGTLAILAVCTLFASRAWSAVFMSSDRPRSSLLHGPPNVRLSEPLLMGGGAKPPTFGFGQQDREAQTGE